MAIKKSELYSSLWQSCDVLRGGMDASQYKDYVLSLLFIKYISDKYAGRPFAPIEVPSGASFKDMVALKGNPEIGDKINTQIIAPLAILIAGNGDVGNLHYFSGKFEGYQRTYVLINFATTVGFLWQQLTAYLAESLGLGKVGSSIPYIKKENLIGFSFHSPRDEAEQVAIAAILSDMDAEITALEAKLTKARQLKQGMMQELLTGRIRLV